MLRILFDRFPKVRVIFRPAKVQGDGAAQEIADAIADLNRDGRAEVLIVGRGGGSLEDLWAFNEEVVARAIFRSAIAVNLSSSWGAMWKPSATCARPSISRGSG